LAKIEGLSAASNERSLHRVSDEDFAVVRKSTSPQKLIAGNSSKYDSYREAWSRIKLAQDNGFFLEAITIQESIIAVDQWRNVRNEAIHAIVKSEPGQPTQPIDVFLNKAKEAAEEGEHLAREICNWFQKEKRRGA
jgi:hypothetical protein